MRTTSQKPNKAVNFSALPELPWQKITCDLFNFNNAAYWLVIVYFFPLTKPAKSNKRSE